MVCEKSSSSSSFSLPQLLLSPPLCGGRREGPVSLPHDLDLFVTGPSFQWVGKAHGWICPLSLAWNPCLYPRRVSSKNPISNWLLSHPYGQSKMKNYIHRQLPEICYVFPSEHVESSGNNGSWPQVLDLCGVLLQHLAIPLH